MTQDQLQGIVTAVVEAVVKTLVEQITPIVVEQVREELKAGVDGVLSLDPDVLAEPVLKLLQTNEVILDHIDEMIDETVNSLQRVTAGELDRLKERINTLEVDHVSIHSDEFKLAVRAAIKEAI